MLLFGVYVFSTDPFVVSVPDNFVPKLLELMPRAISDKALFLVFPTWTKEPWVHALSTSWRLRSLPKSRTVFMCSTQKEQARLKWGGFNTLWCHQNLFCNEDELKYSGSSERIYDAVYTAVFAPYKRHDLLTGVENLRLITGSTDKLANLPKMGLPNVTVNDRYLTKSEVSEILSQCKCGLALSQEEGGMLASTEYLLSGLPVVSTPSIGGRDIYYQKGNHILCDPTVDAVTQAVERAARQDWDRKAIRDHAIEKSKEFRFQLAECVQGMTGTYPFDAREITGSWFTKKFLAIHFMKDFFDSHCGNYFEREDLIGKFA